MLPKVNNYYKSKNEEERIKNIYIKLANIICKSESAEDVKYIVDIEKLPALWYTDKNSK